MSEIELCLQPLLYIGCVILAAVVLGLFACAVRLIK
jgi:hypothetical protein